jgi:hypothetical protein
MAKIILHDLGWHVHSGNDYPYEGDSELALDFFKIPLIIGLGNSDGTSVFMTYNVDWHPDKSHDKGSYNNFAIMLGFGIKFAFSTKTYIGPSINHWLSNLGKDPNAAMNLIVNHSHLTWTWSTN